ncbi:hypothetical protein [Gordonia phthalatica]|uniref:SHOCT domain-containing protein n=1 Tax=Gordonia phthalatica TaxID=1136941 RepID=A0A0N9N9D7_9ACTN|nr:hypothetical protein [Gordonia phthalatica]ALG84010.1 hypothetical protein ACH46_05140 [Gordonia phthalatica]
MRGTTFWKTFAKTLPVLLLTGIVGPVFLILYVVVDEAPAWLLWSGAVIVAILVAVVAAMVLSVTRNGRLRAALDAHGVPAIGRIVDARETGTEVDGRRVMVLDLDVEGPRVDRFTTRFTTTVPVSAAAALDKGLLGVFVGDDRVVATDWKATALYTGRRPARFVSESRNKTYDLTGRADELLRIVDVLRRHGIALGGALDVRDDPEARTEIQAIVDAFAADHDASETKRETVSRRLSDLDDLLGYGQITRGEYDSLRARILNSI